jgi:hypothetical protein
MAKIIRGITNMTKFNSQEEDGMANLGVRILVGVDVNNCFMGGPAFVCLYIETQLMAPHLKATLIFNVNIWNSSWFQKSRKALDPLPVPMRYTQAFGNTVMNFQSSFGAGDFLCPKVQRRHLTVHFIVPMAWNGNIRVHHLFSYRERRFKKTVSIALRSNFHSQQWYMQWSSSLNVYRHLFLMKFRKFAFSFVWMWSLGRLH